MLSFTALICNVSFLLSYVTWTELLQESPLKGLKVLLAITNDGKVLISNTLSLTTLVSKRKWQLFF